MKHLLLILLSGMTLIADAAPRETVLGDVVLTETNYESYIRGLRNKGCLKVDNGSYAQAVVSPACFNFYSGTEVFITREDNDSFKRDDRIVSVQLNFQLPEMPVFREKLSRKYGQPKKIEHDAFLYRATWYAKTMRIQMETTPSLNKVVLSYMPLGLALKQEKRYNNASAQGDKRDLHLL